MKCDNLNQLVSHLPTDVKIKDKEKLNENENSLITKFGTLFPISDEMVNPIYHQIIARKYYKIIAIGDGRNKHGEKAAISAVNTFIEYLGDYLESNKVNNIKELGLELIDILSRVNESTLSHKDIISNSGTISFLGGVLFNLDATKYNKAFVGISVGNFQIFHWSNRQKKVRDITTDINYDGPEGSLGPYFLNNSPNLCDLKIIYKGCKENDMLLISSPGITSNLDPISRGITPQDISQFLEEDVDVLGEWSSLDIKVKGTLRKKYKEQLLTSLINNCTVRSPKIISKKLITHVSNLTENLRQYTIQYPYRRQTRDKKLYPGILDNILSIVFNLDCI